MANVLGTLIVQLQAETAAFARGMADAKQLAFTTSNEIIEVKFREVDEMEKVLLVERMAESETA